MRYEFQKELSSSAEVEFVIEPNEKHQEIITLQSEDSIIWLFTSDAQVLYYH